MFKDSCSAYSITLSIYRVRLTGRYFADKYMGIYVLVDIERPVTWPRLLAQAFITYGFEFNKYLKHITRCMVGRVMVNHCRFLSISEALLFKNISNNIVAFVSSSYPKHHLQFLLLQMTLLSLRKNGLIDFESGRMIRPSPKICTILYYTIMHFNCVTFVCVLCWSTRRVILAVLDIKTRKPQRSFSNVASMRS